MGNEREKWKIAARKPLSIAAFGTAKNFKMQGFKLNYSALQGLSWDVEPKAMDKTTANLSKIIWLIPPDCATVFPFRKACL